ncbi:MAG: hypothetical protein JRJ00_01300 [Deltaproteobacteria bacterium]|nr:hypothetical protein [Deltaproteobacteria bacterium]
MRDRLFTFKTFKENLSKAQRDYNIRVAEGYNPHKRSAKRITILVSEAYLNSGGSIHWIQDLEAQVYRLSKEYCLDCDPLEMESIDRSYICRKKDGKGKPHRDYGKKFCATQFDNHLINETNISKEDIPLARAVIHLFVYNYYKREDEKNGPRDRSRKRFNRNPRSKQGSHVSATKKRASIYKYQQKSQDLSSQRPNEIL